MQGTMLNLALIVATLLTTTTIGCNKSNRMINGSPIQPLIRVNPPDEATDVRLDASISLQFAVPMDTGLFRQRFHLMPAMAMMACLDSLRSMHSLIDSTRMWQMMDSLSRPGHFNWNARRDSCVFRPDSLLQPNMRYMMHFGKEMMPGGSMDNRMMAGSLIGRHEMPRMTNDFETHFSTLSTDEHNSHHP